MVYYSDFSICFCIFLCFALPSSISPFSKNRNGTPFNLKPFVLRSSPPRPSTSDSSNSQSPISGWKCGETQMNVASGSHGVIESPGYPNKYQGGLDCEWRILGEPGTQIQPTIFDLRLKDAVSSDVSDFLYLSLSGNWSDSQRFSGDLNYATPMILVTEGNALFVRFRTSRFTDGDQGFRIAYYVSNTGKPAVTEPGHDLYVVVACNYIPVDHPQIFPEEGISRTLSLPLNVLSAQGINRINPHPYLVALVLDDQQFCSGTLIETNRHVITSAHCTNGTSQIRMVFGTDDLSIADGGVQQRIVNSSVITVHPNFNEYSGANDLSIIELNEPVEITKLVVPASLPTWSYIGTTFSGFKGEIVGWGDSQSGEIQSKASSKNIRISPNPACKVYNKANNGLSMCSRGVPGTSCQADSGSPIITSRAYCNGPVNQNNQGDNGINNNAQRPPKPQKPVSSHNKPNKPGKPKPRPKEVTSENIGDPKYQANVLFGIVSYGTCGKGFSFTRITAHLDFIGRNIGFV